MRIIILLVLLLTAAISLQKPGFDYTTRNRVIAAIKVWDSIEVDFDGLSSGLSEADIQEKYPGLKLDCGNEPSSMGDRSCFANVRNINGVDAWFVAFFFDKDKLNQVKIDVVPSGHEKILHAFRSRYGSPRQMKADQAGQPIIGWVLNQGVLATNETAYNDGTTQILWLSMAKLQVAWLN